MRVRYAAFDARGHVAVGVVAVALAAAEGGHGMFVGRASIGVGIAGLVDHERRSGIRHCVVAELPVAVGTPALQSELLALLRR